MDNNVKYTKKDNYNTLREVVMNYVDLKDVQDRLLAFIDHEVELMDQRAAKSKKYQQEHGATNDWMTEAIITTLHDTDAPLCIADLTGKIIDATPQKLVYRLGRLYKDGTINKETQVIKTDDGSRKVTYYKLA